MRLITKSQEDALKETSEYGKLIDVPSTAHPLGAFCAVCGFLMVLTGGAIVWPVIAGAVAAALAWEDRHEV